MESATKKLNLTIIIQIIVQSFKEFPAIFKRVWIPLFILAIPMGYIQQHLLATASDQSMNENLRMGVAVFSIILSLLESILLLLILPQVVYRFHKNAPPFPFVGHILRYFKPVVIESLRTIGMIAIGLIMLIIPGIKRVIHYMFIAFVVQFNPNYEAGQVDALEESKSLIKDHFLLFFILFFLTTGALIVVEVLLARWNLFVSPFAWGGLLLLNMSLEVLIATILVTLYEQLTDEKLT